MALGIKRYDLPVLYLVKREIATLERKIELLVNNTQTKKNESSIKPLTATQKVLLIRLLQKYELCPKSGFLPLSTEEKTLIIELTGLSISDLKGNGSAITKADDILASNIKPAQRRWKLDDLKMVKKVLEQLPLPIDAPIALTEIEQLNLINEVEQRIEKLTELMKDR